MKFNEKEGAQGHQLLSPDGGLMGEKHLYK